MNTRQTADDILLTETEQTCQQLLACLLQEFDALGQRQYATLLELSQPKQLLIETLNTLDEQVQARKDILQNPRWPALRTALQQCQQQNASNGRLLARSYQLSQETLSILTGRGKTSDTTYNAAGVKETSSASIANVSA